MSFRKLLPRNDLDRFDSTARSYPTVARTGDGTRKGNFTIFFDDSLTTVFQSGTLSSSVGATATNTTLIGYPTTLPLTSSIYSALSASYVTTLNAQGWTSKGPIETTLNQVIPSRFEPIGPFKENAIHVQGLGTPYYLTGTAVTEVGEGFKQDLGCKTTLKLQFPVITQATLNAGSASIYYFNKQTLTFEEVAPNLKSIPITSASNQVPYQDSKLFGPFGQALLSGANVVPFYGMNAVDQVSNNVPGALMFSSSATSVLLDPNYNPTAGQLIKMSDYITTPFLVEKATIEVPIVAGSSWLNDVTQLSYTGYKGTADGGGPCLTFALLNNITNNARTQRDLILSATLIPSGDNTSFTLTNTVVLLGVTESFRQLAGFKSFGTPSGIVPQPAGTGAQFTGSVIMYTAANSSHGFESVGGAVLGAANGAVVNDWPESYIVSVNPFGRAMAITPSGRSYFGKEFQTQTPPPGGMITANVNLFGPVTGANSYDCPGLYQYFQQTASPYILYPNDKLVFSLTKHRPLVTNNGGNLTVAWPSNTNPTGSHDIGIGVGKINVVLYGSQVQNAHEFHDTLNSALTTPAVHEMIGAEPVLDQFDTFNRFELSGTYIDNVISGSLLNPGQGRGIWTVGMGVSNVTQNSFTQIGYNNSVFLSEIFKPVYRVTAFNRTTQHVTQAEQFYDSLIPSIDQIFNADGVSIEAYSAGSFTNVTNIGLTFDVIDPASSQYMNINWSRAFPFEPRYSSLKRTNIYSVYCNQVNSSPFSANTRSSYQKSLSLDQTAVVIYGIATNSNRVRAEILTGSSGTTTIGLRVADVLANVYGFGDKNACFLSGSTTVWGATNRIDSTFGFAIVGEGSAIIRGWKYGLINANPQFSKAVWRRERYGQFRDMLEQRLDTKFYNTSPTAQNAAPLNFAPVQVRFVNSLGQPVAPMQTLSSNLSSEATSSLPYFDGIVRNREDPINYAGINTTLITSFGGING